MHNLDFFYKNIYLYKKIPSFISYIESEVNHLTYERTSFKFKDRNCILDTLIKIDQAQKEAIMEKECDTCERVCFRRFSTPVRQFSISATANPSKWKFPESLRIRFSSESKK